MSNWTHVAGVIRIDALRLDDTLLDFDKLIGKEAPYEKLYRLWDDINKNPDDYLPMGSEGSLHKQVWINPDSDHMAAYTVSIFGDLRDHDNPQDIIDWFKKKCDNMWVRQATITVDNEWNGTINYTYENTEPVDVDEDENDE